MSIRSQIDSEDWQSLYIIKPDAFVYREVIRGLLLRAGLKTIDAVQTNLSEALAEELYEDLEARRRQWAIKSIVGGPVEIGVVEAVGAIATLLEVCGAATNPEDCAGGTIRRLYGTGFDTAADGTPILRNAIHRCKTVEQARRAVNWFYKNRNTFCVR